MQAATLWSVPVVALQGRRGVADDSTGRLRNHVHVGELVFEDVEPVVRTIGLGAFTQLAIVVSRRRWATPSCFALIRAFPSFSAPLTAVSPPTPAERPPQGVSHTGAVRLRRFSCQVSVCLGKLR